MQRMLPVNTPNIHGYLHHAYQSIVSQQHPYFTDWFYSNYIQLCFTQNNMQLNFYGFNSIFNGIYELCPLLKYQILESKILKDLKADIFSFFINCINEGYYIHLQLDDYYISNQYVYNKRHFSHEHLFSGYDLNKRVFNSIEFNSQQVFETSEIAFEEISKAFENEDQNEPIIILKSNEHSIYKFDIENVLNLLNDFLLSKDTSKRTRMYKNPNSYTTYGLDTYNILIDIFNGALGDFSIKDIRLLHILWEHKKCMVSRIEYLYNNNYLRNLSSVYESYKEIEETVLKLRNMHLKYIISGNYKLIDNVKNELVELKNLEKSCVQELINSITYVL